MDRVDVLVVGAGVVGLAAARALAEADLEVVIAEREPGFGRGISSRSSEVLHAGLYYAPGSLKARLCVAGRERLVDYCRDRGVPHRVCGKLVVATDDAETAALDAIAGRGRANGVPGLRRIGGDEAREMEPALRCVAALHSPVSGIVDSHALMAALLADAERAGALLAVRSPFVGARREGGLWRARTGGDEPFELACRWIVDAAGLGAPAVARSIEGLPTAMLPAQRLAKGHYFSLAGRAPFSRLIYPTPVDGGLGVHLTLDLGGQARFGPDVEWLPPELGEAALDYTVDVARRAAFESAVRRYWPALPDGALQPAYAGVRPKLSGPGEPTADFVVAGPDRHGCDGVVACLGIESPGLTACLAVADEVLALVHAGTACAAR